MLKGFVFAPSAAQSDEPSWLPLLSDAQSPSPSLVFVVGWWPPALGVAPPLCTTLPFGSPWSDKEREERREEHNRAEEREQVIKLKEGKEDERG